ncbi:MAG: hypothetical protein QXK24_01830 [Ignisphaera sp.]
MDFTHYRGYFGDRQLNIRNLDFIIEAIQIIKSKTNFKIHLTGLGSSPLTLHIAYYIGANSIDSSGHRRKAAYGKIILPERGERYVGRGDARFGVVHLNDDDVYTLLQCTCQICKTNRKLLWSDWKARAVHNKYVLEKEAEKAFSLLSTDKHAYEKYLDSIFEKSSVKALWKFIKKRVKQQTLTLYLNY